MDDHLSTVQNCSKKSVLFPVLKCSLFANYSVIVLPSPPTHFSNLCPMSSATLTRSGRDPASDQSHPKRTRASSRRSNFGLESPLLAFKWDRTRGPRKPGKIWATLVTCNARACSQSLHLLLLGVSIMTHAQKSKAKP